MAVTEINNTASASAVELIEMAIKNYPAAYHVFVGPHSVNLRQWSKGIAIDDYNRLIADTNEYSVAKLIFADE